MLKAIVAGAIALTIGGGSLVYAQKAPRAGITAEDAQAFVDARLAGIKTGLKLTPEQEKNWPAVETAVRDLAKERISRMQERRAQREARRDDKSPRERRDGIEMLRNRSDMLAARAAGLKRLADAAEPLYKSLDDAQKRRLHVLARGLRARGEGFEPRGMRGHRGSQPL
jgi:hypothetical protein